jgi:aldehyde:ferredoxin oxidoreductase
MIGSNCLNDNIESIIKINDLCNRYGFDTISVGSIFGFAMECYERGIIHSKEIGGIDLTWGNAPAMITLLEDLAYRRGFGAVLTDGSKFAADQIGRGSDKLAMHSGGQDMPAHDPRATLAYGWGYVCDPTPGRHTVSENTMVYWEGGVPYSPYKKLHIPIRDPSDYEANAQIYATFSDFHYFLVSTGFCYYLECPDLFVVELVSAITGWNLDLDSALNTGRRIQTLRQAFNIREGLHPSDWVLPERIKSIPPVGPTCGKNIDFDIMKKKGYCALGWDAVTGKPLKSTLGKLGLNEIVGSSLS